MPVASGSSNLTLVILGLLNAGIVAAVLTGTRLPLLKTDRAAFIAVFVLGMAMCSIGMRVGKFSWTSWSMIFGAVVGTALLAFSLSVMFGVKQPHIANDRVAVLVLAGGMGFKVLVDVVRHLVA